MSHTTPSRRTQPVESRHVDAGWFGHTEVQSQRRAPRVVSRRPHLGPYRVEFHTAEGRAILCPDLRCFPHHTALDPFASHLRLGGATAEGQLLLVDPASGAVVARRRVLPASQAAPGT